MLKKFQKLCVKTVNKENKTVYVTEIVAYKVSEVEVKEQQPQQ